MESSPEPTRNHWIPDHATEYCMKEDLTGEPSARGKVCKVCHDCYLQPAGSPLANKRRGVPLRTTLSNFNLNNFSARSISSLSLAQQAAQASRNEGSSLSPTNHCTPTIKHESRPLPKSRSTGDMALFGQQEPRRLHLPHKDISEEEENGISEPGPAFKPIARKPRSDTITTQPMVFVTQGHTGPKEWT
eukprot:Ihof_evm8s4 gene=Ihof_evmTU8s4